MPALLVVFWVGLSVVVGVGASRRGRSAVAWVILSLILSPLIAGFALLLLGQAAHDPSDDDPDGGKNLAIGIGALIAIGLMAKACSML